MKYKALKSVAHNFGHSFVSLMNYRADDYVMSHLARRAIEAGQPELRVDLLSGSAEPRTLLIPPVRDSIAHRVPWLQTLLASHRISSSAVQAAHMRIRFELERRSVNHGFRNAWEIPFDCWVELTDDRGKAHIGHIRAWWLADDSFQRYRWLWLRRLWWRLTRPAA
jgi:hypothetical protein